MSENRYDAIVIGAGLSGLATGVRLAYCEKRVLLVETHAIPGGLNSYFFRQGRLFDTGLHAFTNFAPRGSHGTPLTRLLRQLRLSWDEFEFGEQNYSVIDFPLCKLRFSNDPALLEAEVAANFPTQVDGFRKLLHYLAEYEETSYSAPSGLSAREMLSRYLTDPQLREMLLCPVMFYGNAAAVDMDLTLFVIVWKCLFSTGLARPRGGIKPLLDKLVESFRQNGGELRFRCPVREIIVRDGKAEGVVLENGETALAKQVFSSAGRVETRLLCGCADEAALAAETGGTSLVEVIACLSATPATLGIEPTVVFYNSRNTFDFRRPPGLADLRSGVIAVPDNYRYPAPLGANLVRISALASFEHWRKVLGHHDSAAADFERRQIYNQEKRRVAEALIAAAERHIAPFTNKIEFLDVFTPLTLKRYTGHAAGALYGSPEKSRDGRTEYANLFLIGADQGFHGIVGALLSGISMANLHGLPNR